MSDVICQRDGAVATITLNRPDRRNAISQAMVSALAEHLLACESDREVRVVVLTGAGPSFCAGLDLQDAASDAGIEGGGFELGASFDVQTAPPNILHRMDTPTICALNGGAAGYGMDLALCCDIRIAARSAKIAAAFTRRGVVPESGGTWLLPRLVGWGRAAEIVFAARTLSAEDCLEAGLVNRVVPDEELGAAVRVLAGEIAGNAPLAVQAAKRMMRMGLSEGFDDHVHHVFLQVLPLLRSEDFREGFTSFLEKREPRFRGR